MDSPFDHRGLGRRGSGARRGLSALAAALLLALPAAGQDIDTAEAVARLQLVAPARRHFMLHGTIPIPEGLYPRADKLSPFAILNHDAAGTLVPAQVEVVSRYPSGQADVVEIFAPVDLAPEDRQGTLVSFSIVASESQVAKAPKTTPRVQKLLSRLRPGAFGLRTRDVYGNVYWADLSGSASEPGFGSLSILKSGPWVRERRVYATMTPLDIENIEGPPLPHLLGVHAYIREQAGENEVALDLRLNNGATSGSREPTALESTLGIVYWKNLQLVLPYGWTAVSEVGDPFLGTALPEGKGDKRVNVISLVKPYPDGRMHMMGPQAQLERRLTLVPDAWTAPGKKPGAAKAKGKARATAPGPLVDPTRFDPGLAFAGPGPNLWSWVDPATARYFPQRDLLALLDFVRGGGLRGQVAIRGRVAKELAALRTGLRSGTASGESVHSGAMGWAHPSWVQEPGSAGDEGISTIEGHYAVAGVARDHVLKLSLLHRMNVCRQPQAAYDRFGDPVGYHAWLDQEGKIPFDFRLNGGMVPPPFRLPCQHGPASSDQVREVVRRGVRPPYDLGDPYEPDGILPRTADCLLAWSPHDDRNYFRYTKPPQALVWLTNDSMAKDDLILAAELYRLARHESPHEPVSWSVGRTLRIFEGLAREHPHQGLPLGREDAWGIDAMCAAYSVAGLEWRARHRPWFDRMSELLLDGAMSTGIVQRLLQNELLGHTRYAATQASDSLFLVHAMRCMNESVFRGVDDTKREALEDLALRGVDYLFFGPPWAKVPNAWQPYPARPTLWLQGPRQVIAVAANDDYQSAPFCDESPDYLPADGLGRGVEWIHPWAALSYAQELSEGQAGVGLANRFFQRGLECGKPHKNWKELLVDFAEQASDPLYDNSGNWVGYLGKLQSLQRRETRGDLPVSARASSPTPPGESSALDRR